MPLKFFKGAKKAADKAKKGYDMVRVKAQSTPKGKSKVSMMKTVGKSKREMDAVIKEGEKTIKQAKTSYIKGTGEPARKNPMATQVAKRLRDAKRYRRKLDKIEKETRKMKTPLKTYSERVEKAKGGMVKNRAQLKGFGKARH